MMKKHVKPPRRPLPDDLRKTIRKALMMLLPAALPVAANRGLNIYLMILLQRMIDAALAGQSAYISGIMLPFFLALSLFIPSDLLQALMEGQYIRRANTLMKQRYIGRVFEKNINEFQSENNALYLSNITNDMNSVEQRYFLPIFQVLSSSFQVLGGIVVISFVNWWVLLIAIAIGLIIFFTGLRSGRSLEKHEDERSGFLKRYTVYVMEILSAFRIVRSNNLEAKTKADFESRSADVQMKRYELDKKETVVQVLNNAMFGLLVAGTLTWAMLSVDGGYIGVGGILLAINGFGTVMGAFNRLAESLPTIASERPIFFRMEENLENRELSIETDVCEGLERELAFDHVSFSYGDNKVLDGACFKLNKGGKYLMIGPSGGGKSTVLRLLRKYFNPDEGAVLLDGKNLRAIRRDSYYRHIANVEQHVFLFDDTLRNNLTLYRDYSDAEIIRAVEGAGLTDYLAGLPDGLDHVLRDNGKNLSGGERARVAVARGLIAHADLLLLDEAFASLDEDVARSIEKTLFSLDDVTVVSVSHVIFTDTAPLYDAVFEVKRGKVTLSGTGNGIETAFGGPSVRDNGNCSGG